MAGSAMNWAATPIAIVPGRRAARLKSSTSVSSAIPKRISPITIFRTVSEDSLKTIVMSSTSVARGTTRSVSRASHGCTSRRSISCRTADR